MIDVIELAGNLLLFCLVFGMSATVDMTMLMKQLKNKKAIATGILLQFAFLPFLGFAAVYALDLSHSTGITLLVVTSSPGGSYSNWWCSVFNADLALSVTMTAVSTVLSIFMLPMNLLIYARYSYEEDVIHNLSWVSLFTSLSVVISAITLGLVMSANFHSHKFNKSANQLGNIAGICLLAFSALMSNTGDSDARLWGRSLSFYVGVASPCILGLIFSTVLTSFLWLKKPERITASIECCYQNIGIATSVALTMFEGQNLAEAMGVPLYYGLVEAVSIGIYCIGAWKLGWTKAPPDANFWTMISTSYEVIMAEKHELQSIEVTLSAKDEEEMMSTSQRTLFTYFRFEKLCEDGGLCSSGIEDDCGKIRRKEPSGYDLTGVNANEEGSTASTET